MTGFLCFLSVFRAFTTLKESVYMIALGILRALMCLTAVSMAYASAVKMLVSGFRVPASENDGPTAA